MTTVSRADRKTIYRSRDCRRIFTKPQNAQLRQRKTIRSVIRRHNLSVWPFSDERLVDILRSLLCDGVFESYSNAQRFFPELFHEPVQPSAPTTLQSLDVGENLEDRTAVSMALQSTLQKELLTSLKRLSLSYLYSICSLTCT